MTPAPGTTAPCRCAQADAGPLLLDIRALARLLGLGKTTLERHDQSGALGPRALRIGRRRLWRKDEVLAWIEAGCPGRRVWAERREEHARR